MIFFVNPCFSQAAIWQVFKEKKKNGGRWEEPKIHKVIEFKNNLKIVSKWGVSVTL